MNAWDLPPPSIMALNTPEAKAKNAARYTIIATIKSFEVLGDDKAEDKIIISPYYFHINNLADKKKIL